jgi:hypothetical protein
MPASRGRQQASSRALELFAVLAALLLVILASSQVPVVRGASTTSRSTTTLNLGGQVTIDKQIFAISVPAYPLLGGNYTLRIVVQNTANITVPIMVRVTATVGAIYTHPKILRTDVQPNGIVTLDEFTMVPFGPPHQGGPFSVTALLYVFFPDQMSSPELVDQATAQVSAIGTNPFPTLDWVVVSAIAITVALAVVFYSPLFRGRTSSRVP